MQEKEAAILGGGDVLFPVIFRMSRMTISLRGCTM